MFLGMIKGPFTGKSLTNYFNQTTEAWVNARRIINGLDKAQAIAMYCHNFSSAISYTTWSAFCAQLRAGYEREAHIARSTGRARRRISSSGLVIVLALSACSRPTDAGERCGWLENPTPGNWWLKNSPALWIISAQGGRYAGGAEKLSEPTPERFVATNGHYGYLCAGVSGIFDDHAQLMTRLDATRVLALSVCRDDKTLPSP
jgi:hypothetical protein